MAAPDVASPWGADSQVHTPLGRSGVPRGSVLSRARYAALGCLLARSAARIEGEDFEYLACEFNDVGIRIQAH